MFICFCPVPLAFSGSFLIHIIYLCNPIYFFQDMALIIFCKESVRGCSESLLLCYSLVFLFGDGGFD